MQAIAVAESKQVTRRTRSVRPRNQGRVVIHPFHAPEGIDVTEAIVAAIAHEIWKRHSGNAVLNWVEAERCLASVLNGEAPPSPRQTAA